MKTLIEHMDKFGLKYVGEITTFSKRLYSETIDGVYGTWFIHEFGGKCFVPYSYNGYVNKSAFEPKN